MSDKQRQKVYRAERSWEAGVNARQGTTHQQETCPTIAEGQDVLDLLAAHFETPQVTLRRNARIKRWGGWYLGHAHVIEVPSGSFTYKTLLHEFAHHLSRQRYMADRTEQGWVRYWDPGHGGSFTQAHIDVAAAWHSPEEGQYLEHAYKVGGCTVGAEAAMEKAAAAEDRRLGRNARNRERQGEEGTVYLVLLRTERFGDVYLGEGRYVVHSTWSAKLWRTEKGARAAAKKRARYGDEVKLYKAMGRFTCTDRGEQAGWRLLNSTEFEHVATLSEPQWTKGAE